MLEGATSGAPRRMLVMHVSRTRRDCTTDLLAPRIGPSPYGLRLLAGRGRRNARAPSRGVRSGWHTDPGVDELRALADDVVVPLLL